jgi:hypothetical protein
MAFNWSHKNHIGLRLIFISAPFFEADRRLGISRIHDLNSGSSSRKEEKPVIEKIDGSILVVNGFAVKVSSAPKNIKPGMYPYLCGSMAGHCK